MFADVCLSSCVLCSLFVSQIAALHKQMPTEEEIKMIADKGASLDELAKPEAFLMALTAAVPAVGSRIDCWHFSLSFHECVVDLKTPFTINQAAIAAVRTSKTLPLLCAVVLHAGNYINGGTNRGQADGFDLSVLGRLGMIKDATGTTNMMQVGETCRGKQRSGVDDR